MGNRRWRTAQKGTTEHRWANRLPVCADKDLFGHHLGMTLVAERILGMGRHRHKFAELLAVAAFGVAGEAVRFIAAKTQVHLMRNTRW